MLLRLSCFASDNLRSALSAKHPVFDWQVGEAMAEAYLVDHRQCEFPWPSGRDLRNPEASPAGADLVGFHVYMLQGEPPSIDTELDRHFESARKAAQAGGDATLDVILRWLHVASRRMVASAKVGVDGADIEGHAE